PFSPRSPPARTTNNHTIPYTTLFRSMNKADSFRLLREKADTVQPLAYQTTNLIHIRYKDQSVKKDTTSIFLHLDKNIIKREDLRSEEHTSELQSREKLVCRLLHEKTK